MSTGGSKKFEEDFLAAHNAYRKQHGAPPLRLSRELCQSAQKWVRGKTGNEPVDSWYSEIKNYNFGNPGFAGNTGHFTQVVWKDSKEVGVGVATDGKGLFFVVGQYNPAGNITNHGVLFFIGLVLPPPNIALIHGPKQF
uniref:SCP domain-containing protein n=1 Tax=Leptobrachium leishanense TaxID=445787 RepID=A0A8C5R9C6_9ANUR